MKSRRFLILFIFLPLSCTAGTNRRPSSRKQPRAKLKTDPVLSRHLRQIRLAYDRKRFISFYKGGIEKPLDIRKKQIEAVIRTGLRYLGRRYRFGQLDCSSFIYRIFRKENILVPHTAELQARYGRIISNRNDMQRGDLIFFTRTYTTAWFVTHVGIYMGDNRMLHASSDIVRITEFPEPGHWWNKYFIFATRILEEPTPP